MNGINHNNQKFRDATNDLLPLGWTFRCKFCGKVKELRGHQQRMLNGKRVKICKQCQEGDL